MTSGYNYGGTEEMTTNATSYDFAQHAHDQQSDDGGWSSDEFDDEDYENADAGFCEGSPPLQPPPRTYSQNVNTFNNSNDNIDESKSYNYLSQDDQDDIYDTPETEEIARPPPLQQKPQRPGGYARQPQHQSPIPQHQSPIPQHQSPAAHQDNFNMSNKRTQNIDKHRQQSFANSRAMFEQRSTSPPQPAINRSAKPPVQQRRSDSNNNPPFAPKPNISKRPTIPTPAAQQRVVPPQPIQLQEPQHYEMDNQSEDSGCHEDFYIEPHQAKNAVMTHEEETYEVTDGPTSPVEIISSKPKGMPGQQFITQLNRMTLERSAPSLPVSQSKPMAGRPLVPTPDKEETYEIAPENPRSPPLPGNHPSAAKSPGIPSRPFVQSRPPMPVPSPPPQEEETYEVTPDQAPALPPSHPSSRKSSSTSSIGESPRTSIKDRLPNPRDNIQEDYEMITHSQRPPPQLPISSRPSPPQQRRPPPSLEPKGNDHTRNEKPQRLLPSPSQEINIPPRTPKMSQPQNSMPPKLMGSLPTFSLSNSWLEDVKCGQRKTSLDLGAISPKLIRRINDRRSSLSADEIQVNHSTACVLGPSHPAFQQATMSLDRGKDTCPQPTIERIPSYKKQTQSTNAPTPINRQTPAPAHPLSGFTWFQPELDRRACEIKLNQNRRDGDFVIRNSSKAGVPFSISIFHDNVVRNLQLLQKDGKMYLGSSTEGFGGVAELVSYHQNNEIILNTGGKVKLLRI
ncbi:B-cell linker protein-like isoform X4 [Clytia hemisphaerica]|uniref:B-cell linker protein-like isoform X4 n=1 Tax=Clytia hemisphaerica TaxID=252671 RepID=UPI0034D5C705